MELIYIFLTYNRDQEIFAGYKEGKRNLSIFLFSNNNCSFTVVCTNVQLCVSFLAIFIFFRIRIRSFYYNATCCQCFRNNFCELYRLSKWILLLEHLWDIQLPWVYSRACVHQVQVCLSFTQSTESASSTDFIMCRYVKLCFN